MDPDEGEHWPSDRREAQDRWRRKCARPPDRPSGAMKGRRTGSRRSTELGPAPAGASAGRTATGNLTSGRPALTPPRPQPGQWRARQRSWKLPRIPNSETHDERAADVCPWGVKGDPDRALDSGPSCRDAMVLSPRSSLPSS